MDSLLQDCLVPIPAMFEQTGSFDVTSIPNPAEGWSPSIAPARSPWELRTRPVADAEFILPLSDDTWSLPDPPWAGEFQDSGSIDIWGRWDFVTPLTEPHGIDEEIARLNAYWFSPWSDVYETSIASSPRDDRQDIVSRSDRQATSSWIDPFVLKRDEAFSPKPLVLHQHPPSRSAPGALAKSDKLDDCDTPLLDTHQKHVWDLLSQCYFPRTRFEAVETILGEWCNLGCHIEAAIPSMIADLALHGKHANVTSSAISCRLTAIAYVLDILNYIARGVRPCHSSPMLLRADDQPNVLVSIEIDIYFLHLLILAQLWDILRTETVELNGEDLLEAIITVAKADAQLEDALTAVLREHTLLASVGGLNWADTLAWCEYLNEVLVRFGGIPRMIDSLSLLQPYQGSVLCQTSSESEYAGDPLDDVELLLFFARHKSPPFPSKSAPSRESLEDAAELLIFFAETSMHTANLGVKPS